MAADKASSIRGVKSEASKDQTAISEDITRIVGYLNTKRSNASDLTSGLAQELSNRREDLSRRPARESKTEQLAKLDRRDVAKRERSTSPVTRSNPLLAEKYHAFCHDLDVMLDGFRARVDGDKPVQH